MGRYARKLAAGIVLAVLFFVLSLASGRFYVPPDEVAAILGSRFLEVPITWDASMYNVVMEIRLPRVLGDILVGVALAVSFLMLADLLARTLTAAEIPLGILCGFVGTPFFAWILYQQRRFF